MNTRHTAKLGLAGLVTAAVAGTTLAAPAHAQESSAEPGTRSLAKVLGADRGFDRNWHDYDILEKAVLTVLKAKPSSPVSVLAKGNQRVTAFLPTDAAFRALVKDLTGTQRKTERGTFRALARIADVDTVESVLLYHVIVGKTLGAKKIVKRDGKAIKTALGATITVKVKGKKVILVDQDRNDRNPRVVVVNINQGNKQIAHGIDRVLRPIDL